MTKITTYNKEEYLVCEDFYETCQKMDKAFSPHVLLTFRCEEIAGEPYDIAIRYSDIKKVEFREENRKR